MSESIPVRPPARDTEARLVMMLVFPAPWSPRKTSLYFASGAICGIEPGGAAASAIAAAEIRAEPLANDLRAAKEERCGWVRRTAHFRVLVRP